MYDEAGSRKCGEDGQRTYGGDGLKKCDEGGQMRFCEGAPT